METSILAEGRPCPGTLQREPMADMAVMVLSHFIPVHEFHLTIELIPTITEKIENPS
jgi:hypothetical protein